MNLFAWNKNSSLIIIGCLGFLVLIFFALALIYLPTSSTNLVLALCLAALVLSLGFLICFKRFQVGMILLMIILPVENLLAIGAYGGVARYVLILTTIGSIFQVSRARKSALLNDPIVQLLALFVIWSSMTILWSVSPDRSLVATSTHVSNLALLVVVASSSLRWLTIYWGTLIASCASSVLLSPLMPRPEGLDNDLDRFTTGGQDPNDLCGLFIIVISIALYWLYPIAKTRLTKCLLILCTLMMVGGILLTGSRTGAVTFLVSIVPLFFQRVRQKTLNYLYLVAVLNCIFIFTGEALSSVFGSYLEQLSSIDGFALLNRFLELDENTLARSRWDVWMAATEAIKQNFVLGVGAGALPYTIDSYSVVSLPRGTYNDELAVSAHSIILSVWSETGLVGISLFASFLIISMKRAFILSKSTFSGLSVLVGLAVVLTMGITLTWETKRIIYILLGTLCVLWNVRRDSSKTLNFI
ncbi:MAG: O-antigen ligase family protein [Leptolyngbya sp. Prado105]|jgi:O-antigen ligase|nr:O-antigen ligase family protein [Leptolyngbya sp. Prado105]